MRGLHCRPGRVIAAPLALFFYTEKRQLQPLAIHMDADSSDRRLLFLFTDSSEDWLQAKLWFNLADACHHMIAGRLLTHLLLESIYVSMRRNLAQSHPIYQLLAPHFRSLLAVNSKLKDWIFDKGWIARNIQLSKKGIKQLLKRAFKQWRFDVKANVYAECESRGVYDRKGLGNYPYRDDAFLVYGIFDRFIVKFLRIFYPRGPVDLLEDVELQSWRKELSDPMEDGGLGLEGIPCGKARIRNGVVRPVGKNYSSSDSMISDTSADFVYGLTTIEETKSFVLGIIHLLVIVAGSALRLPMFDEYGFTPHYPLSLFGQPPFHSDFDERGRRMNGSSVSGISSSSGLDRTIAALPNQRMTVEMVLFTRICSRVRQSVLGKYDSNFILDPRAVPLLEEFQKNLEDASRQVAAHNRSLHMLRQLFNLFSPKLPKLGTGAAVSATPAANLSSLRLLPIVPTRFVLNPLGVAPSRGIKSKEVKRYWTEDGTHDPPLQDAVDRFKKLRWGAYIHARAGRRKHLYRKNPWVVAKKDEHILTNRATSFLVDNLMSRYWRRPQFYPEDIYEPYHKRTGVPWDYELHKRRFYP
ncbi:Arachidonate 5-lipoxygenase [Sparganum proliferum]